MPINFLGTVFSEGSSAIPYWDYLKTYGPYVAATGLVKRYFAGATNTWERKMNGSVVMITGGTSGVGAVVARELAQQGAQVILLARSTQNEWLYDFISDLRENTGNALIYAEECDLGDLHSVRKFATKWLDNSPPRRLDQIICCAGVATPPSVARRATQDGIEEHLQINYMAHYHLLTLLAPATRVQPADRDVRIILTSCVANVLAEFNANDLEFTNRGYPQYRPWKVLGASKLALTMFAYEYQRQANAYERPDKMDNNVHVCVVDPGMMRSPSFKRFISCGSLLGLVLYIMLWPIWWLFLKTSIGGAQSILYASMSPHPKESDQVSYISECGMRPPPPRKELKDERLQKELFEFTEKFANDTEKKSVLAKKRFEKDDESKNAAEKTQEGEKKNESTKTKPKNRSKKKT